MIVTRIDAAQPMIVPQDLLAELGLKPGDEVAIERLGDQIVIMPASHSPDGFVNNFSTFTEWNSEEDGVYDAL